jgi:hypothetical protein
VDIKRRRWLYIDVDRVKAKADQNESATDEEKERTAKVCQAVSEYLAGHGWPAPVVSDSGNGYGVFYRLDLPNELLVKEALAKLLATLKDKFSGPDGEIDGSVYNADRLAKVPGTWARKGQSTDDRPHRASKLLVVPDVLVPVTLDQIRAATAEPKRPEPAAQQKYPEAKPAAVGWQRAALVSECNRVAFTRVGERDNALMKAAFRMGQIVAGGGLERDDVERCLFAAACRCGLDEDCGEDAIRDKIARGIVAGMDTPRAAPEQKADPRPTFTSNGRPEPTRAEKKADADPAEPLTVRMSDITPLDVEWLMRNRIPKRFITVLAGRTGIGKSFISCDLIARISRGDEIPFGNGECFPMGGTLIMSEDSHEYVLAPRLIWAGADLSRINAMTWKAMGAYHLGDTEMLTRACAEVEGGVSVVMIDPPTNFLEGIDEHKNADVRQLVMRVVEWALARDIAVLFILHVNKNAKGVEALNRVMGSVAWVTTARIAHTLCPDPQDRDRNLFVTMKNNLGEIPKAIAYRIAKEDGRTRVEWIEEVDVHADDAMGGDKPRERRDISAAKWLIEKFRERLEWESKDLFEQGKQEGISRDAIFEAKRTLKLPKAKQHTKENGDRVFYWWVPADWPALADGEEGIPTL